MNASVQSWGFVILQKITNFEDFLGQKSVKGCREELRSLKCHNVYNTLTPVVIRKNVHPFFDKKLFRELNQKVS